MNLLEEVALHLEWAGLGEVATAEKDGDIHWGRMPDSPDDCICVFSTDTGTGGAESLARFQIMNRSRSTKRAYETSCEIGRAFDGFNGFLHGDGRQAVCETTNCGTGLGADTLKREMYVTNITMRYCEE